MRSPSEAETDFQQAVAWLDSDPVFGSLASASDVLLDTRGLSLLGAGSSSLSGLTDMLTVPASLGGSTERNES